MTYSWQVGGWQPRGAVADLTNVTASGASAADRSGATYPGPYGPTWDFGGDRLVLQTSEKIEGGSPDHVDWARICVRTVTAQGTNGGWSYLLMVDTFGGKPPTPPAGAAAAPPPQGAWTASPFSCTYLMLMPAATPR